MREAFLFFAAGFFAAFFAPFLLAGRLAFFAAGFFDAFFLPAFFAVLRFARFAGAFLAADLRGARRRAGRLAAIFFMAGRFADFLRALRAGAFFLPADFFAADRFIAIVAYSSG